MDAATLADLRSKLVGAIDTVLLPYQTPLYQDFDGRKLPSHALKSAGYQSFPETYVGPWETTDDGKDGLIENREIHHIRNNLGLLVTLSRPIDYLIGKGVKIPPSYLKPVVAWKSVVLRNLYIHDISLDLVASEGDRIHTDGIYIRAGINADVTIENVTIENTDGSCMPFIVEDGTYMNFTLKNVAIKNAAHSPIVKAQIDTLVIDGPGVGKISFQPGMAKVRQIILKNGSNCDVSDAVGAVVVRL